jgi:hypothetical protein
MTDNVLTFGIYELLSLVVAYRHISTKLYIPRRRRRGRCFESCKVQKLTPDLTLVNFLFAQNLVANIRLTNLFFLGFLFYFNFTMLLIRPLAFALLMVTGILAGKTTTTTTKTTTKTTTTPATTTTSTAATPVSTQSNYCGSGITSYCCTTDGSSCSAMGQFKPVIFILFLSVSLRPNPYLTLNEHIILPFHI